VVRAYEPAFGIIGDPAKRDPKTRQSADHSMLYLVCTMLRKALEIRSVKPEATLSWKDLMLAPHDFDKSAIHNSLTRSLMAKMTFEWGGAEYDSKYPDGIPTSMVVSDDQGNTYDSGLVMYPGGHARNSVGPDVIDLKDVLGHKFELLGSLASKDPKSLIGRIGRLEKVGAADLARLYDFEIEPSRTFEE
jgi:2-methylcitrate dehydratase